MKYFLFFIFLFSSECFAGGDYLKIRSYPPRPLPGATMEQSMSLQFRASLPDDIYFEKISSILNKISKITNHNLVALHQGHLSLELHWKGKTIRTVYSKYTNNIDTRLTDHWTDIFNIVQEMTHNKLSIKGVETD